MNDLKAKVNQAAYDALAKTNPAIITALKKTLKSGDTAKKIERRFAKKYGNGNLISNSAICAAYHIEANPELLEN